MLILKSTTSKERSKYICDSCGKELNLKERVAIHKAIQCSLKKKYDLCPECWKRLRFMVEKHKLPKLKFKKKESKNEENVNV